MDQDKNPNPEPKGQTKKRAMTWIIGGFAASV